VTKNLADSILQLHLVTIIIIFIKLSSPSWSLSCYHHHQQQQQQQHIIIIIITFLIIVVVLMVLNFDYRACNFRYIAIQWEKPTTYGDALITGYKVYVNGIVEAVLSADSLSYTFTQGKWCQEYSFQVQVGLTIRLANVL
jgi:uncharacterized integral membrane protein